MTKLSTIKFMKKTATYLLISALVVICQLSYSQESQKADSIYSERSAELPVITWNINPVGVLLYGPIIQMEFKISNKCYIVPWIRYSYAGLVSRYQWTNFESDQSYDPSSIAFAVGFKKFLPGDKSLETIYYGFFAEYSHEKGLHDTQTSGYEYEQTRDAVVIYGNLGYRWHGKKNFFVSMGILPGLAYNFKNDNIYTESGGPKDVSVDKFRFIGMLDVAFGWNIKNQ
jgi:hypothetical protein